MTATAAGDTLPAAVTRTAPRMPLRLPLAISTAIYLVLGGAAALLAARDPGVLEPRTSSATTLELLTHNVGVLGWLAAGVCSAGLLTVAVLGLNAIMLGWVIGKQIAAGDLHSLLTGMLPHFPFEIAGYLLSGAASIRLGLEVVGWIRRRTSPDWTGWAKVQLVSVLLLLVAAIVEANISHV